MRVVFFLQAISLFCGVRPAHEQRCLEVGNTDISTPLSESFPIAAKVCIITFPVFVKPVRGSASIAINKVDDKETLELLWNHNNGLMIQEYLKGQEIGADCYIEMLSHELVSIFTKKKILMRAGETDKAVSFKEEKLFFKLKNLLTSAVGLVK